MKRSLFLASLLCAIGLSCLSQSEAWAQQTAADIVEIATDRFGRQDYEGAATAFLSAYELSPDQPVLMKNAVVAWFKADRCDRVVPLAKQYLELQPELGREEEEGLRLQVIQDRRDANKAIFKCQVKEIESLIARDDLAASKTLLAKTELHSAGGEDAQQLIALREQIKTREAALAPKDTLQVRSPAQREQPASEGRSTQAMVGWALLGVGGATLVAGGVYSIYTQVAHSGEVPQGEFEDGVQAVEDHNARAWVIYPVGVGLAAAGAALLWLDEPDQDAVTLLPATFGPGSAGVSASMRF